MDTAAHALPTVAVCRHNLTKRDDPGPRSLPSCTLLPGHLYSTTKDFIRIYRFSERAGGID
ncbi:hypothetical protein E2C01_098979 [Portunus trituberculatus]|uniref:Uncharacterized protein n=1 Tax=Portunus trituberculatus TaxID=210409 RepID=A0A5B7K937_PORTR|nr:hypothetical protein [Portunus trituberculatus]